MGKVGRGWGGASSACRPMMDERGVGVPRTAPVDMLPRGSMDDDMPLGVRKWSPRGSRPMGVNMGW